MRPTGAFFVMVPVLVAILSGGPGSDAGAASTDPAGTSMRIELGIDPSAVTISESEGSLVLEADGWVLFPDASGYLLPARSILLPLPAGVTATGVRTEVLSTGRTRAAASPGRASALPGDPSGDAAARPVLPAVGGDGYGVVSLLGVGSMGGRSVASLLFRSVAYDALESTLEFRTKVAVTVELAPTTSATGREPLLHPARESRGVSQWRDALVAEEAVESETAATTPSLSRAAGAGVPELPAGGAMWEEPGRFQPGQFPSLDGSFVEYVIVTSEALEPAFERLARWKTSLGVPAVVRTVEWIEANYPGVDRQERIRRFLQDAYRNWGTLWVLLAGNQDIIPARIVHTETYGGENIAADLYYSDLDGTWDGDGDGLFGEGYDSPSNPGDGVDLYPDVIAGRAPVATPAEADIFIDKVMEYLCAPQRGYQDEAVFIAEVLFPQPWNPGDPIYSNGCDLAQEAIDYVPATWNKTILCEWPDQTEDHDAVVAALEAGPHLVTVYGHGDPFKWSTSDGFYFELWDAQALTNAGKYFVLFYANCNTNQIETDTINEFLLLNQHGGSIASVAATRFDFPNIGRKYHAEFYRLFFNAGVREVGALESLMKVPWVGVSSRDVSYDRWTQLTYILMGDPELSLWRNVPGLMAVSAPGTLSLGDSVVTVGVEEVPGGSPVPGARVTLWKEEGGEYARGETGLDGTVRLVLPAASTGWVSVSAVHGSYLPVEDSLEVVTGSARLEVVGVEVDDDSTGASMGNGNGRLESGERAELRVRLGNGSGVSADSVRASLVSAGGSEVRLDATVDGVSEAGLVYLGEAKETAATLPAVLGAGGGGAAWGRPLYSPRAVESADSARVYGWQDASGWHVRCAGAGGAHTFTGSFATDGKVEAWGGWSLESGDTVTAFGDSLWVSFEVDSTDFEDGVDVVVADSTGVTVVSGSAELGTVGAGAETTATFVVQAGAEAGPRRALRFGVGLTAAGEASWTRGFRLDVREAELRPLLVLVDDALPGGDGDGVAEPGETVSLGLVVSNEGDGAAEGVQAVLRALSGATVVDSVLALGDVAAGEQAEANGFTVTVVDSVATCELGLTSSSSSSESTHPLELGVLAAAGVPGSLDWVPGQGWMELSWGASSATDLAGYVVYRSSLAGGFDRVTGRLSPGAYFRDEGLSVETAYRYRIAGVDTFGLAGRFTAADTAWTGPPYQSGFPVWAWNRMYSSPAVVDLDANGDWEIVSACQGWRALAWKADGSDVPGWPPWLNQETFSSPAIGNLDADPEREVVVGSGDKKVYAFNHDGSGYLNPSGVLGTTGAVVQATPTLADLDGDGSLEILVPSKDGWLYVWRSDGTGYLSPDGKFASFPTACISSVAVADVDQDSHPEIFLGITGSAVYAWNHDGTAFRLPSGQFKAFSAGAIWAAVAIGDVDADGAQEIVVASQNDSVYVMRSNAAYEAGWPQGTGGSGIISSPALGDLDRDGKLEVVVGSNDGKLYAWHYNGVPVSGFPAAVGDSVLGSPVIGDISGDGYPDVVAGSADNFVYAFDRFGQRIPGWPQRTHDRIWHSAPVLMDLDHDGDVEVGQGSYDGYFYVWDLSAPYDASTMDWPMFQHDRYRSGFAGWTDPDPATAVGGPETSLTLPAVTRLGDIVPNPANPQATVRFDLAAAGRVRLAIYDVTGRLVARLVDERRPAGRHQATWNGFTAGERPAATGVYFVRLDTDAGRFTRKMLLVR